MIENKLFLVKKIITIRFFETKKWQYKVECGRSSQCG